MRRFNLFVAICFFSLHGIYAQSYDFSDAAIENRMREDVYLLASDSLQGREAGTYGEYMARTYIAGQFKQIGLKPFSGDTSYFQTFTYADIACYGKDNHFLLNGKSLGLYADYYALTFSGNGSVKGNPVCVGYGISAPEDHHDDYAGLQNLAGKIFIIKTSVPDTFKTLVNSSVYQRSGKADKVDLAIQKGAKAVIFIRPGDSENEPDPALETAVALRNIPVVFLRKDGWIDTLGGDDIDLSVDIKQGPLREAHNIAGYIDNRAETWVVIGAHYDHLGFSGNYGIEKNPALAVFNGADDNASGTAGVMEIARYLSVAGLKNNNYIFVAFSAEEKGLYGSRDFAARLKSRGRNINYMINLDMIGQLRNRKGLIVFGTGTSPAWNKALRKTYSLPYKMTRIRSGLGGSDHMSFYNESIPDIFLFTGTHKDYHKPGDDPNTLNYTGAVSIVKFAENIIAYLDDKGKLEFRRTGFWSAFFGALRTM